MTKLIVNVETGEELGSPVWLEQPSKSQPRSVTIAWTVDSQSRKFMAENIEAVLLPYLRSDEYKNATTELTELFITCLW